MAVENNASDNMIVGFGVKERIPSTKFDLFSKLNGRVNRTDYVHIVDEFWID